MKIAQRERTTKIVLTALFSALIAVGAFIKIPVPAVPFTLQFFFVNMSVLFLGKKRGALAVGIYVALGLIGVPIFTSGGGIFYVLHPTFGYLIGFLAGNFVAGAFLERVDRTKYKNLVAAGFIDAAIVYALGLIYFYLISTLYLNNTVTARTLLVTCFLMTFWSDTIFIFFTAFAAKKINTLLRIDFARNPRVDAAVFEKKAIKGYRLTRTDCDLLLKSPIAALCRAANRIRKRSCGSELKTIGFASSVPFTEPLRENIDKLLKMRDEGAEASELLVDSKNPDVRRIIAFSRFLFPSAVIAIETGENAERKDICLLLRSGANALALKEKSAKFVALDTKSLHKIGFR